MATDARREQAAREELKHEYGIHGVQPLPGQSVKDVLDTCRQMGPSEVKDRMKKRELVHKPSNGRKIFIMS